MMKRYALFLLVAAGCKSENNLVDEFTNRGAPLSPPFAIATASQLAHVGHPITLDGTASYDPDDDLDRLELAYTWTVVSAPEGANYNIDDPTAETPTFTADTIGIYDIDLVVTDVDELESRNPAGTVVEVTPWTNLEVVLSWDTVGIDLDLHLLQPEGVYFRESDCYFGNPEPDWGEEDSIVDNPALLADDEGDLGEEVILLPQPESGIYGVGIHYFNDKEAEILGTSPTITIRAEGQEMFEIDARGMSVEGQVQVVGWLDWDKMVFDEVKQMTTHNDLGGPPVNKRRY